ncbi:MAG: LacI family DNA-binding transcriptional regulator [bacterium]
MNYRVTIKDVAEAAEVSVSTVSQVLNGRAGELRISKETQARVLTVIRQTGFVPNRMARDMVLGRRSFIGLVLSVTGLAEAAMLLPELEPLITTAGYRLILVMVPADPNAASVQVADLLRDGVAGLVCSSAAMPVAVKMAASNCPVIGLSPAAGKTILATLRGEVVVAGSVEQGAPSKAETTPLPVPVVTPPTPVTATSVIPTPPPSRPIVPEPKPLSAPVTPISPAGSGSDGLTGLPQADSSLESEVYPSRDPEPDFMEPILAVEPGPVLTPSSGVVAAVPSGTGPEPAPTVTPTPEPTPIITEPVQADLAYTPPPISEPQPEPVAPVLEPEPEIAAPVTPAPESEPTPVVITPVEPEPPPPEPAPVFIEPTPIVEPGPVIAPASASTPSNQQPINSTTPTPPEPETQAPAPEPPPVVITPLENIPPPSPPEPESPEVNTRADPQTEGIAADEPAPDGKVPADGVGGDQAPM